MCGRFSVFIGDTDIERRFDATPVGEIKARYNVAPGQDIPAIEQERPDKVNALRWGFVPRWADDPRTGTRPINARGETVYERPLFSEAFAERRCLIPADGFYEWHRPEGEPKQPHRIAMQDDDLFAFAGIYETWTGADGDTLVSAAIITTDANDVIAPIHDRMPVILGRSEERAYLAADADEARDYLDPYDGDDLYAYPISTLVNDPANDGPKVVEPLGGQGREQSGLDDFPAS